MLQVKLNNVIRKKWAREGRVILCCDATASACNAQWSLGDKIKKLKKRVAALPYLQSAIHVLDPQYLDAVKEYARVLKQYSVKTYTTTMLT